MKAHALALLIPCAILVACGRTEVPAVDAAGPPPAAPAAAAEALLGSASGSSVTGTLQLTTAGGGVSITGALRGLPKGSEHGFHIHERGDCSAPDASSAGEHLNPDDAEHGNPKSPARHLGDLPNIESDEAGNATISVTIPDTTLHDGGSHDLVGRAVVVHAQRDDYVTQPAGDSGDRIACGVVR